MIVEIRRALGAMLQRGKKEVDIGMRQPAFELVYGSCTDSGASRSLSQTHATNTYHNGGPIVVDF